MRRPGVQGRGGTSDQGDSMDLKASIDRLMESLCRYQRTHGVQRYEVTLSRLAAAAEAELGPSAQGRPHGGPLPTPSP